MQMLFRAGPARDCATEGHDVRLLLADRAPRGACIASNRPATFIVRACSGCGERVR